VSAQAVCHKTRRREERERERAMWGDGMNKFIVEEEILLSD
jgi:hypothetical protein